MSSTIHRERDAANRLSTLSSAFLVESSHQIRRFPLYVNGELSQHILGIVCFGLFRVA